jgi:hypothetical protein
MSADKIRPISDVLVKEPFLAIRCALSGFEDGKANEASVKKAMQEIEAKMETFKAVSAQVLSSKDDALIIKVPRLVLN